MVHQQSFSDDDKVEDTTCNMISIKKEVILRNPTKEEIDRITIDGCTSVN